jgi:hypothetical protein
MADNAKNFAKSEVSTGYDASATSVVLASGGGAKMPTAPFNAVWWNATDYSDPSDDPNVEIVRVTNVTTDTLTVTRAQESTSATTKNAGGKTYKVIAGLTANTVNSDLEKISSKNAANGYAGLDGSSKLTGSQQVYGTTAATAAEGNDSRITGAQQTSQKDVANGYAGIGSDGRITKRSVLQVVFQTYNTYTSTSSAIPSDDTIPTSTEGAQIFSVPFTPKSASSTLLIRATAGTTHSSTARLALTLFQGSSCVCTSCANTPAVSHTKHLSVDFAIASGSISARTYSVRFGASTATCYINGNKSTRHFGGTQIATFEITEYL